MAANVNYYATFNTRLVEFLEDLRGVMGDVPDYNSLVTVVKTLSRMNERQNARLFIQYVSEPYKNEILDRNEAFFVTHDYTEANAGDIVQLLKGVWNKLAQEDKDMIWEHLNLLVIITQKLQTLKTA